jgi:hypothetical protein
MWYQAVWQIFTNILDDPAASIFYPENGGNKFLQNISNEWSTNYMVSHPKRQ